MILYKDPSLSSILCLQRKKVRKNPKDHCATPSKLNSLLPVLSENAKYVFMVTSPDDSDIVAGKTFLLSK